MRPATPLICAFIDAHEERSGVAPVCRALAAHGIQIAPGTYWAQLSAGPSRRALRDAAITEVLAGVYEPGPDGRRPPESLDGSVKMRAHLQRQGIPAARCTAGRIMRASRWRGTTRARTVRAATPDPAASRAPDLVRRQFTAARPDQLGVADFTYVPLASGFGYTAFVIDAFAGLIPDWECSVSKRAAFAEPAIRQAVAFPRRGYGSIALRLPACAAPCGRSVAVWVSGRVRLGRSGGLAGYRVVARCAHGTAWR